MIPAPAGIALIALVAVAVAVVIRRVRQVEARDLAAHHQHTRIRTADQVMGDVRDWKSERNRLKCEALWALPAIPEPQRKDMP
ncbi:hypothetical protein [Streptomyces sp. NPDC096030]|uniref:hypothetical protein n=1 Tax=Streptomyces sp. NPDC096030 TaxID=3155423 RepID=UPI00331BB4CA